MKFVEVIPGLPPVEFVTISELATACGNRTRYTLLELIQRGYLPESNFRLPNKVIKSGDNKGVEISGVRLYSKEILLPKLVNIFSGIKQGKKITIEQRAALVEAFDYERHYYTNIYGKRKSNTPS